jgi:hypothetical protein
LLLLLLLLSVPVAWAALHCDRDPLTGALAVVRPSAAVASPARGGGGGGGGGSGTAAPAARAVDLSDMTEFSFEDFQVSWLQLGRPSTCFSVEPSIRMCVCACKLEAC